MPGLLDFSWLREPRDPLDFSWLEEEGPSLEAMGALPNEEAGERLGLDVEENPLFPRVWSDIKSGMYGLAGLTTPMLAAGAIKGNPLDNPAMAKAEELQQSAGWGHPGGELREDYLAYQLGKGASPFGAAVAETIAALAGLADPTDILAPAAGGLTTALGALRRIKHLGKMDELVTLSRARGATQRELDALEELAQKTDEPGVLRGADEREFGEGTTSPRLKALEAAEAKADALAESGRLRPEDLPVLSEAIKDSQRLAALGDEEGAREVLRRVENMMRRTFPDESIRELSRVSDEIGAGKAPPARSFDEQADEALRIMGIESEPRIGVPPTRIGQEPPGGLPPTPPTPPAPGSLPGPPRPPGAGRADKAADLTFRYFAERLGKTPETTQGIIEVIKGDLLAFMEHRRAGWSMAEVSAAPGKIAARVGKTPEQFMAMRPGDVLNADELTSLDWFLSRSEDRIDEIVRSRAAAETAGDYAKLDELDARFAVAVLERNALLKSSVGASTEAGRALRSRREIFKILTDCVAHAGGG